MKKLFLSRAELQKALPWSKNVVEKMIQRRIFIPVRNPVGTSRSKVFFWKPQVEEAISVMINTSFHINSDEGDKE